MTADFLTQVTERADAIVHADESDDDPEGAHCDQDTLAYEVIQQIATYSTDPNAKALAAQVLRTFETDGTRWYA